MRDGLRREWLVGLVLSVTWGCGGDSNGCVPSEGFFGKGATYCDVPCVSWTNLVRPGSLGTGRFDLDPDYSASPPRALIAVGQGFHARVLGRDLQPSGCNTFLDGPFTFRSTDDAVLAYNGTIYQGVAPGTARVIVDMPTPSGGTETVELTVCRQPDEDPYGCENRVPLDIQVLP